MNKELKQSFINTSGAVLYIFGVSQIMAHGEVLFGGPDNSFTPFAVLLLFSLSAAVVGGLVLGRSVLLFLDNKKSESVRSALYSIGWLALYTFIGLAILVLIK